MKKVNKETKPYRTLRAAAAACIALTCASPMVNAEADRDSNDTPKAAEYWKGFKHDTNETWKDSKEAFRDGWLESKLETALILSEHLNPFTIDIEVKGDTAYLTGEVDTEIAKDHATFVAKSVQGIDDVKNGIKVTKDAQRAKAQAANERSFKQTIEDSAITARVKTDLLTNSAVKGLKINVDTLKGVVTLSGEVETDSKRELAGYIAKENNNVVKVINNLQIKS